MSRIHPTPKNPNVCRYSTACSRGRRANKNTHGVNRHPQAHTPRPRARTHAATRCHTSTHRWQHNELLSHMTNSAHVDAPGSGGRGTGGGLRTRPEQPTACTRRQGSGPWSPGEIPEGPSYQWFRRLDPCCSCGLKDGHEATWRPEAAVVIAAYNFATDVVTNSSSCELGFACTQHAGLNPSGSPCTPRIICRIHGVCTTGGGGSSQDGQRGRRTSASQPSLCDYRVSHCSAVLRDVLYLLLCWRTPQLRARLGTSGVLAHSVDAGGSSLLHWGALRL